MSAGETKECPFCAETIKAAAVLCRFCGRDLLPHPATASFPPSEAAALPAEPSVTISIRQTEIFDLLTALIEKSLVVYEEDEQGRGRYRMLETVRQYSRDRLLEAEEANDLRQRHAAFFLALAEEIVLKLSRNEPVAWLGRLDVEYDNMRAALDWTLGSDAAAALRLAGVLGRFWQVRSRLTEGREWLERALEAGREASPSLQARALNWLSGQMHWQGDYARMTEVLEESRALAEQVEWLDLLETEHDNVRAAIAWSLGRDPEAAVQLAGAMAWFWFLRCHWREGREQLEAALRPPPGGAGAAWVRALAGMCWLVYGGGDYAGLHALVDQCQALAREAGDGWHLAFALGFRAMEAMSQGEPDRAAPASQESLELAQEIGDPWLLSLLASLAAQVLHVETHDQAEALLGKAAALGEQTGDRFLIGLAWGNPAGVNLLQGRYEEARTRVMQSMRQMLEMEQRALLAPCLEILAGAEAGKKCGARAAQLLGTAAALREVLGYPVERVDLRFHDWALSAACDQLTPEAFAAAWAAGRALTLEQVLADVLEEQADA